MKNLSKDQIVFVRQLLHICIKFFKSILFKQLHLFLTPKEQNFLSGVLSSSQDSVFLQEIQILSKFNAKETHLRIVSSHRYTPWEGGPRLQNEITEKLQMQNCILKQEIWSHERDKSRLSKLIKLLKEMVKSREEMLAKSRKESLSQIIRLEQKLGSLNITRQGYKSLYSNILNVYRNQKEDDFETSNNIELQERINELSKKGEEENGINNQTFKKRESIIRKRERDFKHVKNKALLVVTENKKVIEIMGVSKTEEKIKRDKYCQTNFIYKLDVSMQTDAVTIKTEKDSTEKKGVKKKVEGDLVIKKPSIESIKNESNIYDSEVESEVSDSDSIYGGGSSRGKFRKRKKKVSLEEEIFPVRRDSPAFAMTTSFSIVDVAVQTMESSPPESVKVVEKVKVKVIDSLKSPMKRKKRVKGLDVSGEREREKRKVVEGENVKLMIRMKKMEKKIRGMGEKLKRMNDLNERKVRVERTLDETKRKMETITKALKSKRIELEEEKRVLKKKLTEVEDKLDKRRIGDYKKSKEIDNLNKVVMLLQKNTNQNIDLIDRTNALEISLKEKNDKIKCFESNETSLKIALSEMTKKVDHEVNRVSDLENELELVLMENKKLKSKNKVLEEFKTNVRKKNNYDDDYDDECDVFGDVKRTLFTRTTPAPKRKYSSDRKVKFRLRERKFSVKPLFSYKAKKNYKFKKKLKVRTSSNNRRPITANSYIFQNKRMELMSGLKFVKSRSHSSLGYRKKKKLSIRHKDHVESDLIRITSTKKIVGKK